MGAYASLIGEVVRVATQADCLHESVSTQTVWFSGWLGKTDYEALVDLVPEDRRFKQELEDKKKTECSNDHGAHVHINAKNKNQVIVFPGVTVGFADPKTAKNHIKGKQESKQAEPRKIVFEVTNCNAFTYSNCAGPVRRLCHRLTGMLESYTVEEYARGKYYHCFRLHYIHKA
jgi:hypothetical protein